MAGPTPETIEKALRALCKQRDGIGSRVLTAHPAILGCARVQQLVNSAGNERTAEDLAQLELESFVDSLRKPFDSALIKATFGITHGDLNVTSALELVCRELNVSRTKGIRARRDHLRSLSTYLAKEAGTHVDTIVNRSARAKFSSDGAHAFAAQHLRCIAEAFRRAIIPALAEPFCVETAQELTDVRLHLGSRAQPSPLMAAHHVFAQRYTRAVATAYYVTTSSPAAQDVRSYLASITEVTPRSATRTDIPSQIASTIKSGPIGTKLGQLTCRRFFEATTPEELRILDEALADAFAHWGPTTRSRFELAVGLYYAAERIDDATLSNSREIGLNGRDMRVVKLSCQEMMRPLAPHLNGLQVPQAFHNYVTQFNTNIWARGFSIFAGLMV